MFLVFDKTSNVADNCGTALFFGSGNCMWKPLDVMNFMRNDRLCVADKLPMISEILFVLDSGPGDHQLSGTTYHSFCRRALCNCRDSNLSRN